VLSGSCAYAGSRVRAWTLLPAPGDQGHRGDGRRAKVWGQPGGRPTCVPTATTNTPTAATSAGGHSSGTRRSASLRSHQSLYVDLPRAGYGGLLMGRGGISPIPIAKRLAATARSRSSTNANSGSRHAQRQDDLREMREWRRSRRLVFWNARMRARPAGPAQSSVFHNIARRGPTKEAHRRALNRPDGLLHSVAGQGHGRFLPVTLPRERPDLLKRAVAGSPCPLTP